MPAGAFSLPLGAVLTATALLTGVGLVLSEETEGSLPLTIPAGPAIALVLVSGTCGIYLLLAAWSTFASGPGSSHPPGRRLRLALFLLGLSASGVLVALPAVGALIVDASGPNPHASGWTGAHARSLAGALVALVSGAGGAYLLRDVRRRRARQHQRQLQRQQHRQRARAAQRTVPEQGHPHTPGEHHLPEQRKNSLPQRGSGSDPDRQRASG
jgi:hypothetical protein